MPSLITARVPSDVLSLRESRELSIFMAAETTVLYCMRSKSNSACLANPDAQRFIDGKPVRKIIVVPKKLVNIVV